SANARKPGQLFLHSMDDRRPATLRAVAGWRCGPRLHGAHEFIGPPYRADTPRNRALSRWTSLGNDVARIVSYRVGRPTADAGRPKAAHRRLTSRSVSRLATRSRRRGLCGRIG